MNIDKLKRSTMVNSGGNSVVLQGPIIIHSNSIECLFALHKSSESTIMFQGYIEFSKNKATYMIESHTIFLMEHVVMNVTRNVISYSFIGYKVHNVDYVILMCFFQFYGTQENNTNKIFSVIIEYTNVVSKFFDQDAENINCEML